MRSGSERCRTVRSNEEPRTMDELRDHLAQLHPRAGEGQGPPLKATGRKM
ncbi:hypothetical protein WME94_27240 [Sorangium sp. So ce429]